MNQFDTTYTEMVLMNSKLDRIESMLIKLTAKKKPVKKKAANDIYSKQFESLWSEYPKRTGNNPKAKAHASYLKRRNEGVSHIELEIAATAYCMFCDATIEDKQYVMMAATFYGCQRPYAQDWTIPTQAETIPKDDNQLIEWAKSKGFRSPHVGETWHDYRQAITTLHRCTV